MFSLLWGTRGENYQEGTKTGCRAVGMKDNDTGGSKCHVSPCDGARL